MGFIFSENKVSADPKLIDTIIRMPESRNVTEVQIILGLCGYLSQFILDLADLTATLRKLVRKDADNNGAGCVLLENGRSIAFESKRLTETEKKIYAQIEKEILSVCFSCKKFHAYEYGAKIEIYTDKKPLDSIFKNKFLKPNN
ncbi:hypothetical protein PR048_009159, partial [Dryococelus australis]